jgi:hypothetical protein
MSAGHIRRRGPGAWELKFDISPGPLGKRRTRTATVRGSKRNAQVELRRLLAEIDRGGSADTKTTVGAWLGRWLIEARHTTSPKTHERYTEIVQLHLIPALGAIPLAKLRPWTFKVTTPKP